MHGHERAEVTTKAYWMNTFRSVRDPEKLAEYVELAGSVMREVGGRFLARDQPARVFEAGVGERSRVIEFESVEQAVAAYDSSGYQRALRALGDGTECDARIIDERVGRIVFASCETYDNYPPGLPGAAREIAQFISGTVPTELGQ
jgi:uncharacterized protein (DUF1330 family)